MREATSEPSAETAAEPARELAFLNEQPDRAAGELTVAEFVESLRGPLTLTISRVAQRYGRTAEDCPYLEHYLGRARRYSPSQMRRMVRRWVGHLPSTPDGLRQAVLFRAEQGARDWFERGAEPRLPGLGAVPGLARTATRFVQRMFTAKAPGASSSPRGARRAMARLGSGHTIAGGIRGSAERSYGVSLGNVVAHTGAEGAKVAEAAGARAVAFGDEIAFASGEYRPGTLSGDALIGHEFAHVVQARSSGLGSDHEASADRGAAAVVLGQQAPAQPAGGLKMRACFERTPFPTEAPSETDRQQLIRDTDLSIIVRTHREGRTLEAGDIIPARWQLWLELGHRRLPNSMPHVQWTVTAADGSRVSTLAANYRGAPIVHPYATILPPDPQERTGTITVRAEFPTVLRDGAAYLMFLERELQLRTRSEAADELIGGVPSDYVRFRTTIEANRMVLAHGGLQDQRLGRDTWITSGGSPNPAVENDSGNFVMFDVHPLPDAASFEWFIVPHEVDQQAVDPPENTVGESNSLGTGWLSTSTGPQCGVRFPQTGSYALTCKQYDSSRTEIGRAQYIYAVLTEDQVEAVGKANEYIATVDTHMRMIEADKQVAVRGAFVGDLTGQAMSVMLFIGETRGASGYTLVDLTPGVQVRHYSGSTVDAAFTDFEVRNKYPHGRLFLEVVLNSQNIPAVAREYETNGTSALQNLSRNFGLGALGLTVLGGLAMITPLPGARVVAVGCFILAAGAGFVSSTLSLVDHLRDAELSGTAIALDLIGMATSFIGGAQGVKTLAQRGVTVGLQRVSSGVRFMIIAGFAGDAASAVLVTVDGIAQIVRIGDSRTMSTAEKTQAVVQILYSLAMQGGLLAISVGDVSMLRTNSGFTRQALSGLSDPQVRVLGLLDGPARASIADAGADDLRRVTRLARQDPVATAHLLRTNGDGVLDALRANPRASLDDIADGIGTTLPRSNVIDVDADLPTNARNSSDPDAQVPTNARRGRSSTPDDGQTTPTAAPSNARRAVGAIDNWNPPAEFHTLPSQRLPDLPDNHSWRRVGETWVPMRATGATEVNFEVQIYGPDSSGAMNMVVRTADGRVLGSSVMTRPRGGTYDPNARVWPMDTDDFEIPANSSRPARPMDRGHVIDHADTLQGDGVVLSTTRAENFVPEPTWWNQRVRSGLVGRIRRRGGGYREINVYPDTPELTSNQTPVPVGKYFIETDAAGNPVNAWYIDYRYNYSPGEGLGALDATGPFAPRRITDLADLPTSAVEN